MRPFPWLHLCGVIHNRMHAFTDFCHHAIERQGVIHADRTQHVTFACLVAAQAIDILIVFPGNDRLNQRINASIIVA